MASFKKAAVVYFKVTFRHSPVGTEDLSHVAGLWVSISEFKSASYDGVRSIAKNSSVIN